MEQIRVLIAESQGPLRTGLANILGAEPDISVVGEASDGLEAIDKALALKPQLILMDARLTEMGGLGTLSRIKKSLPTAITVILTDSEQDQDVLQALLCGAQGYLLKSCSNAEIVRAVKKAAAGELVLSDGIAGTLVKALREESRNPMLSRREAEVLMLLGDGLNNREISNRLVVSGSTVRTYICRLQEKLGLKSRLEVTAYAGRRNLSSARTREKLKLVEVHSQSADKEEAIPVTAEQVPVSTSGAARASYTVEMEFIAGTAITAERKLATALAVEVECSGDMAKAMEPDKVEELIYECLELVSGEIRRHGGTIMWLTASGLMSLFGVPLSLEHGPLKALHTALAIQEDIRRYGKQSTSQGIRINTRIGVNTGVVRVNEDTDGPTVRHILMGNTTGLAARVRDMAEPGAIMVTESTYQLTRYLFRFKPLGEVPMVGQKDPVNIHRLVGLEPVKSKLQAVALHGLTKFVGRQKEIEALKEAVGRAKSGSVQVVGIVGEAGLGKSRLLLQFREGLSSDEFTCLEGSCIYYGDSIPYLPFVRALRSYFDIPQGESQSDMCDRLKAKGSQWGEKSLHVLPPLYEILSLKVENESYLKLEPSRKKERIFEAIRDVLLMESRSRSVVLAIEDCHWIDRTSEELLSYLIASLATVPILIILLYRPEYSHQWCSRSVYSQITLGELPQMSVVELIRNILAHGEADPEVHRLIVDRAGGNPLFVEELTRSLWESGSIQQKGHSYLLTRKPSGIRVPASLQGIIEGRIDRLDSNLKHTLQIASVIGRDFSYRVLESVSPIRGELKSQLSSLQRSEFVYQRSASPEPEYVFKHALIQEVAYNSLLFKNRRELHEKTGNAIEHLYSDRLEEFYEVLAYHYQGSENWDKAYQYLKLSGDKAARSYSKWEAFHLYKEAINVVDRLARTEENRRRELEIRFSIAAPILCLGFPEDSLQIIQDGAQLSKELGDGRRLASFNSWLGMYYSFRGQAALGIQYSESSFLEAEKLNDIDLMARASVDLCTAYHFSGKDYLKAIDVASKVIALLEKTQRQSESFGSLVNPYCAMLSYYSMAMNFIGDFRAGQDLYEKGRSFALEIRDLTVLGLLEVDQGMSLVLLKGDSHHGIKHLQDCIKYCEEGQLFITLGNAWIGLGMGYYMLGEPETARKYIEKGIKMNSDAGMRELLSAYYVTLIMIDSDSGDLERAQGRAEEALSLARDNQEMWPEGLSRVILGRVLGKRNERPLAEGEAYILAGIKILEEVKVKPIVAQAQFYLGELYADAGQTKKALACLKRAEGMCQEMGMDYYLLKTRNFLSKIEASGTRDAADNN